MLFNLNTCARQLSLNCHTAWSEGKGSSSCRNMFSTASLPSLSGATQWGTMLVLAAGPSRTLTAALTLRYVARCLPGAVHDSVRCARFPLVDGGERRLVQDLAAVDSAVHHPVVPGLQDFTRRLDRKNFATTARTQRIILGNATPFVLQSVPANHCHPIPHLEAVADSALQVRCAVEQHHGSSLL